LLAAGHRVRCLVRDPARLQGREWLEQMELATATCCNRNHWSRRCAVFK
jgi:hypothetical protein